jgi:predicted nucleic acid-binding protein
MYFVLDTSSLINLSILSVGRPIVFSALSNTDSYAISLALENNSTVVSEDGLLRENAIRYGVPAIDVAGLLLIFYQEGRIDKSDCLSRLKVLFENQILSKSRYHQLLISLRS